MWIHKESKRNLWKLLVLVLVGTLVFVLYIVLTLVVGVFCCAACEQYSLLQRVADFASYRI